MTEKKTVKRRDGTGHLDPQYERKLLEQSGHSRVRDDVAFIGSSRAGEELSEELGEAFIESATSGGDTEAERHDRVLASESGGPFVPSTAREEFAAGTDESNIAEATREPLPRTSKAEP